MKILLRIFNECFIEGEWYNFIELPDEVAYNIHLKDKITPQMLRSFPAFDCKSLVESLTDVAKDEFYRKAGIFRKEYRLDNQAAEKEVWTEFVASLPLVVTDRVWWQDENTGRYYLEIHLEDDSYI